MCVCVPFGRLGLILDVFYLFPHFFPDRVPHWICSSPICVKWLANQFQGLACHCVPSSWIVGVRKHAQLFIRAEDLNSGVHACIASTLQMDPALSSHVHLFYHLLREQYFLPGSRDLCLRAPVLMFVSSCGNVGQPLYICLSWSGIAPVWSQKLTNKLGFYYLGKFPQNDVTLWGG